MKRERARGALLGLAVGDALGTTYEFARIDQPDYPELATGPATDVVGKGPFALAAGVVTDDTQLAVCLATSLAARRGFDAADAAERYVAWQECAFDIGNQTRSALRNIERTGSTAGGMQAWRESGHHAAGNGSLMRTAPIAVALASISDVIDASIADSMLTHADPRCMLACAAYNAAIATVIASELPLGPASGALMIEAARAALETAAARLRALWGDHDATESGALADVAPVERTVDDIDVEELALVDAARADLVRDLEAALADEPDVYGDEVHMHDMAGFVRTAFRLAFWHAVHTPTWRSALVDIASRGGDADTNGAIAGALLGARDGEAAIPAAWRDRVLAARQPGTAAWAEAHHPKHLLAVL